MFAALNAIARTVDPKDAATVGYDTFGEFDSQEDYLAHVSNVLTHKLDENGVEANVAETREVGAKAAKDGDDMEYDG